MGKAQEILEKPSAKSHSKGYSELLNRIEELEKIEGKLRCCIDFMRGALSKEKVPAYREFWDAKSLCLELFKETIPSRVRTLFWNEYVELSGEMRRLKELLDEQSSFAHEQIDLAIQALEKDLVDLDRFAQEVTPIEVPEGSSRLMRNQAKYQEMQKSLYLLNSLGERVHALRKELISTSMRMRQKAKQFEQLAQLGNQIFPRRKELSEAVSTLFKEDVESFVSAFTLDRPPFFGLKDEIRAMQAFAKLLTLQASTFNHCRKQLSGCWEQMRKKEEARRQERSIEKGRYKENVDKIAPKIAALQEECAQFALSLKQADDKISDILAEMKELELGRDEVKRLKGGLFAAKKPLEDRAEEEILREREAEASAEREKKEKVDALLGLGLEVLNQAEVLALDLLVEKWAALVKERDGLVIEGSKEALLESRLSSIADHIQEKKWRALLEQNADGLDDALQEILEERQQERGLSKRRLEGWRKAAGRSGLDFEESMRYQELISGEKLRLDAIETMIEEIEGKLFDIEE